MAHGRRRQGVARLVAMLWVVNYAALASGQTPGETPADQPAEAAAEAEAAKTTPLSEEITVTATRFERPIDLTPRSVSVVVPAEIASRPMANVQSVLEDVPGVSYARGGGLGGQLVVRGLNTSDSRTVLFIDGDRFGRGRPALEYNFVDPNEIERIEIIRGPASALYGSDAMNGVVNVITRRTVGDPTQPFSLTPRLGSLGYSSASSLAAARLALAGLGNGFDLLVGANYRSAGNYRSPLGEVPNSDFTTRSLNARIGYSPGANRRYELVGKAGAFDAGRAGGPGAPLVIVREDPLQERSLRLGYTQSQVAAWLDDVEASLYVRNLSTIIRSENRTAANGNVEFRDTWVIGPLGMGGKLLARSTVGDNVLAYGVDLYHEDVPSFEDEVTVVNAAGVTSSFSRRAKRVRAAKQTAAGLFAHYDLDPSPRWTASLGTRYDAVHTEVGATPALGEDPVLSAAYARNLSAGDQRITGSAGLIFRPVEMLHLVADVSTAFRAPTTFDKSGSGVVGAVTTIPNVDVEPETSVSYEVGARLRLSACDANLTAFRTDYDNLLQLVFLNPTTRQRQNADEATIEGFELDGTLDMTKALALRFNVANVRGTNTQTGTPLAYVPPLNGLIALRYAPSNAGYWLETAARWSVEKTRIDRSQERPSDGYEVFSVYAGFDLGRFSRSLAAYRLTVGIENLADETYVNPTTRGLNAFPVSLTNPLVEPGRSLTVNLTSGF